MIARDAIRRGASEQPRTHDVQAGIRITRPRTSTKAFAIQARGSLIRLSRGPHHCDENFGKILGLGGSAPWLCIAIGDYPIGRGAWPLARVRPPPFIGRGACRTRCGRRKRVPGLTQMPQRLDDLLIAQVRSLKAATSRPRLYQVETPAAAQAHGPSPYLEPIFPYATGLVRLGLPRRTAGSN